LLGIIEVADRGRRLDEREAVAVERKFRLAAARVLDRDLARIVGAIPARHTRRRLDPIGGPPFGPAYPIMECRVEGLGGYGGIKRHDWTTPLLSLVSGHFSLSFTHLVYSSVVVK